MSVRTNQLLLCSTDLICVGTIHDVIDYLHQQHLMSSDDILLFNESKSERIQEKSSLSTIMRIHDWKPECFVKAVAASRICKVVWSSFILGWNQQNWIRICHWRYPWNRQKVWAIRIAITRKSDLSTMIIIINFYLIITVILSTRIHQITMWETIVTTMTTIVFPPSQKFIVE